MKKEQHVILKIKKNYIYTCSEEDVEKIKEEAISIEKYK